MDDPKEPTPNLRLKYERERRGWSQEVLADKVGASAFSVSQWELGKKTPGSHNRKMLCELFEKNAVELGFVKDKIEDDAKHNRDRPLHEQERPFPPIWNVPYERNTFFTGREDILRQLRTSLVAGEATALTQTLSGLGGVGKTHIAVEYCYKYRGEYKAVMWAKAGSREELIPDLITIAKLLRLPESKAKEQQPVINALRKWMREQPYWLLVLDNIESIETVRDIIPPARRGHILLTTRTQVTGNFSKIIVQDMPSDEGALLLLRRANILDSAADLNDTAEPDRESARNISYTLGGLPLALDQAGAYIQETGCGLSDYLKQYQIRRAELLSYRGAIHFDYPESVATTWSLSFKRIEKANLAATDLLRACAFLHPDAIPEELFTREARNLGPSFQPLAKNAALLDQIIGEILKYSLIKRNPKEKTLTIHRLVQAVLADTMDKEEQGVWAERLVKALNGVLSVGEAITSQPEQRYLLHAQTCAELVNTWKFTFLEAAQLYSSTGRYLRNSGYYMQAEDICSKALDMLNGIPGASATDTCQCLTTLVLVKADNGDLIEAESIGERLLVLCEEALGPEHPYTAFSLYYLANIYLKRGKDEQAEPLLLRALTICRSAKVPQFYPLSETLMSLAKLYSNRNNFTQAETHYLEALRVTEQTFGSDDPKVAAVLTELAIHYSTHEELVKAERLRKRALEIYTRSFDLEHPDRAIALAGLSVEYFSQQRYAEAEEYYEQAMKIWERKFRNTPSDEINPATLLENVSNELGNSSMTGINIQHILEAPEAEIAQERGKEVATISIRLANALIHQEKYSEAETLLWHALKIAEKTLGKEDLVTVYCLGNLARLYQTQKQYVFAEFLYERALQIAGVKFKLIPAGTQQIVENYIQFLKETGREQYVDELQRYLGELRNL